MERRRTAIRTLATLAGATLVATGLAVTPAAAQTLVPCSPAALAGAITAANGTGGTLVLAPGCVYALSSPLPAVQNTITILGNGATLTRAALAPAFRILTVNAAGNLRLFHATISKGDATGDFGGGIRNDGSLTVTQSVIRNNQADFSGGIGGNTGSTTRIIQSIISGNSVIHNGGGLANDGDMTIAQSSITQNTAQEKGGGVANDATLKILQSAVSHNAASGPSGVGGGIANFGGAGATTQLTTSLVVDNTATNAPGGIYNDSGSVALLLTHVHNNHPTNCAGSPTAVPGCLG
ncbi:hypothetical protein DDE74_09360 [Streptomyces lydicus]|uniref:Right handed beta helix domain-containing protein n=1 Tax=Streptomyces lydicus TaxID=47763 RepID=A0A3Q9K339_9ACTN|nr:hypothetical protein [Streptomyces lydicus]AZS71123.1 hypothetical protein DDE74_09360 [Streptomyces lydicus]